MIEDEINIENLKVYYNWCLDNLLELPAKAFDMKYYTNGDLEAKDPENLCGTSCCLLGHAPKFFGVDENDFHHNSCQEFDYLYFSKRVFGVYWDLSERLDFVFSSDWSAIDNSVEGALKRLKYVLDGGKVPTNAFEFTDDDKDLYKDVELVKV